MKAIVALAAIWFIVLCSLGLMHLIHWTRPTWDSLLAGVGVSLVIWLWLAFLRLFWF